LEITVGWSGITAAVVAFSVTIPIVFLLLKRVLSTTFLRVCLIFFAVHATNWAVALALVTWFVEPFRLEGNAMSPTVLGEHHKGQCAECGSAAYGAHLTDPRLFLRQGCPFCDPDDEIDVARSGDDRKGICGTCMRISVITDVDSVPRECDHVILNKLLPVKRWDIVVYSHPADPTKAFVHRVIGLPGETITIVDGKVRIDGKNVTVPFELTNLRYLLPPGVPFEPWATEERPAVLSDDEYFVLGDLSILSNDSRLWQNGAPNRRPYAVPREYIRGVVTHIYWPFWRFRQFR
jgi:signal peptidase I